MKKTFLFSVLLLLSQVVVSQIKISDDFTTSLSDPYKVVDGTKHYFSRNNEILAVKYGRGVFTFQKFSGDKMNETKRVEIDKTTGFTLEKYTEINGKYYFFYSIWDRDNFVEQLFVREIDFDGCRFVDEGRRIVKVEGKVTGGFTFFENGNGKFDIITSFDESRVLVQYRKYPENKIDRLNNDVIGMHIFDSDMEEIWAVNARMPYTEQRMKILTYTVDSDGNAYVVSEVYKDDSKKRRTKTGDLNYDLELIKISASDLSVVNTPIKLDDKITEHVKFFEGKDGELVLAGCYGNNSKGLGIDGFFMSKIIDDEVMDINYYEIPLDVMQMYLSERQQNKLENKDARSDLKLQNMVLREINYDENGGITIYSEKYYVVANQDPKTGQTTYTYYYQEIVGAGIDADGELRWMKKFPKNQVGGSDLGGMGYHLISTKDTDYILFLDNVKNIELPMDKFPKAHRDGLGGYLTGFKVDRTTGETEKISLLDTRNVNGFSLYQFKTSRVVQVNDKTICVECYIKQKEDVMVTIKLN